MTFLFDGLTGVILASPPLDLHVTDSYFVVAHFHYVVFGTLVFAMFAGFYYWWPKFAGRMLNETWGKVHFWTLFIDASMTVERVDHPTLTQGRGQRPVGLGAIPAGDVVSATQALLRFAPAGSVDEPRLGSRAAGVGGGQWPRRGTAALTVGVVVAGG